MRARSQEAARPACAPLALAPHLLWSNLNNKCKKGSIKQASKWQLQQRDAATKPPARSGWWRCWLVVHGARMAGEHLTRDGLQLEAHKQELVARCLRGSQELLAPPKALALARGWHCARSRGRAGCCQPRQLAARATSHQLAGSAVPGKCRQRCQPLSSQATLRS